MPKKLKAIEKSERKKKLERKAERERLVELLKPMSFTVQEGRKIKESELIDSTFQVPQTQDQESSFVEGEFKTTTARTRTPVLEPVARRQSLERILPQTTRTDKAEGSETVETEYTTRSKTQESSEGQRSSMYAESSRGYTQGYESSGEENRRKMEFVRDLKPHNPSLKTLNLPTLHRERPFQGEEHASARTATDSNKYLRQSISRPEKEETDGPVGRKMPDSLYKKRKL